MKTCTKCGEEKPTTEFYKNAGASDGLRPDCKVCKRASVAAQQAANPENHRAQARKWYAANRERAKANAAAYRSANPESPEKMRARSAAWHATNRDKVKVRQLAWRTENRDRNVANAARWYAANRDRARANATKWQAANPEACRKYHHTRRARKRESGGTLSKGLATRLFNLQRGKCACGCGEHLGTDYHLDHRMPLALGGANADWNIQLLRPRCNLSKGAKHPVEFMQSRGFLL